MDLKALIAKMDQIESKQILNEAITMKDIQAAVGQEQDEQKRANILNDLAWKEKLPGLYDPISGYFVRKQSMPAGGEGSLSISATAREADTKALAQLGLVPGTAKTSALGGLVGTGALSNTADQNAQASKAVKNQSAGVQGGQSSDAFYAPKIARLKELITKISSTAESFNFNSAIARSLVESFSYKLVEKVTLGTGPAVTSGGVTAGKFQGEIAEINKIIGELGDIDQLPPEVSQVVQDAKSAVSKVAAGPKPAAGAPAAAGAAPTPMKGGYGSGAPAGAPAASSSASGAPAGAPAAADPNAPRDEQGVNIANKPGAGVNAQGQNVTMPGGINPETGEPTVTTAGAPAGAPGAAPAAGAKTPAAAGGNVLNVQKQLAALGIDPGPADGKMGDKTIAGIKAFEKMAGKPETGKLTPEFEKLLAQGAQIKSQSNLVASLGAMEKILTKYKVESVTSVSDLDIMTESEIRSYVMKNLGRLDGSEQMQFMQAMLSEAPERIDPSWSNGGALVPAKPGGISTNVTDVPYRDVTPTKPGIGSKIADFGRKVLNKGVGKVAAAGAAIAAGGYAAYQGLAKLLADPAIQMSPADKAEFEKHLAVIGTYTKDAEAGAALPKDVQQRLSALNQRLTKIAGKVQGAPAAPGAAPAQGGTTNTTTNTSVQGELKMGKPSGPITFNGKVVQPGAPEYAAASAALIKAQGGARDFRSRNDKNVEKNLSTSGAPVSQGAANADRRDF